MSYAVLCPGQGAQHAHMLDRVREESLGRDILDEAQAALGADITLWLTSPDAWFRNLNAQPLICIAQLGIWAILRERLPPPIVFAGYSVGELACYGLAGALDATALATLSRERAERMDRAAAAQPGGLISVRGLTRSRLERLCSLHAASIAIAVDEDAFVIGGLTPALQALQDELPRHRAQITRLNVGVASHTPWLVDAVESFRAALEHSSMTAPKRPVIAGIDAGLVTTRTRAISTLAEQVARTVEWAACMDSMVERGCRIFLELGPGRALSTMMRGRHPDVEARSVEEFGSLAATADWVRRRVEDAAAEAR